MAASIEATKSSLIRAMPAMERPMTAQATPLLQACTGRACQAHQRTDSVKIEGFPDRSEDGKNCVPGFGDLEQIVDYYHPPDNGFALADGKLLHEVTAKHAQGISRSIGSGKNI